MTTPLRVLVADDEPDMRQYFQKILPRLGYQVVAAAVNGRELVDLFRTHAPDLIITDLVMPIMNGLDAVREIQRECPIPVIVVSATENGLAECADAELPMCDLVKPIRQADLTSAITRVLQGQPASAENEGNSTAAGSPVADDGIMPN
jgi:CheY-like chemotaxis protein